MCLGAGRKNRRYQDRGDIGGGKRAMAMSKRNPGSAIQLQNDQALMNGVSWRVVALSIYKSSVWLWRCNPIFISPTPSSSDEMVYCTS